MESVRNMTVIILRGHFRAIELPYTRSPHPRRRSSHLRMSDKVALAWQMALAAACQIKAMALEI